MSDFDVVVITGAFNPWNVVATGTTELAQGSVRRAQAACGHLSRGDPVAAADLVAGRKLTGWLASKDSVEIMGGEFQPAEWAAAIDGQIVTGRTPPEIPEFDSTRFRRSLLDG